jgi:antitoxin FitA
MLSLQPLTASEPRMATLTVRNLDEVLVKRLRVRAAENGRSAEAEHREILRAALEGREGRASRDAVASRLAEFRRRIAGRGSPSSTELLEETRRSRAKALAGPGDSA